MVQIHPSISMTFFRYFRFRIVYCSVVVVVVDALHSLALIPPRDCPYAPYHTTARHSVRSMCYSPHRRIVIVLISTQAFTKTFEHMFTSSTWNVHSFRYLIIQKLSIFKETQFVWFGVMCGICCFHFVSCASGQSQFSIQAEHAIHTILDSCFFFLCVDTYNPHETCRFLCHVYYCL